MAKPSTVPAVVVVVFGFFGGVGGGREGVFVVRGERAEEATARREGEKKGDGEEPRRNRGARARRRKNEKQKNSHSCAIIESTHTGLPSTGVPAGTHRASGAVRSMTGEPDAGRRAGPPPPPLLPPLLPWPWPSPPPPALPPPFASGGNSSRRFSPDPRTTTYIRCSCSTTVSGTKGPWTATICSAPKRTEGVGAGEAAGGGGDGGGGDGDDGDRASLALADAAAAAAAVLRTTSSDRAAAAAARRRARGLPSAMAAGLLCSQGSSRATAPLCR
jgi:hypothetical protein